MLRIRYKRRSIDFRTMPILALRRSYALTVDSSPSRFYPPGATAGRGQLEKFSRLVNGALRNGASVELEAIGKFAARHSLYALSAAPAGAEFRVFKIEEETEEENGTGKNAVRLSASRLNTTRWRLRLVAQTCARYEDGDSKFGAAQVVQVAATTQVAALAKRLSIEVCRTGLASVTVRADAVNGVGVLLEALAQLQELGFFEPLRCTVHATTAETRARGKFSVCVYRTELERSYQAFRAFPPGNSDSGKGASHTDVAKRFERSVVQRLARGQAVEMDCRGKHAICSAIMALSRTQGHTAEFEVHWIAASSLQEGKVDQARALSVWAVKGDTWDKFNAQEFSNTARLRVGDSTNVKSLAQAIGFEALKQGGVSVHAYADTHAAVSVALKALASSIQEHGGQRFVCVPSLGYARRKDDGSEGKQLERRPLLRLFVRPRGSRTS